MDDYEPSSYLHKHVQKYTGVGVCQGREAMPSALTVGAVEVGPRAVRAGTRAKDQ